MVLHGARIMRPWAGGARTPMPRLALTTLVVLSAVAAGTTSCADAVPPSERAYVHLMPRTHWPAASTSVLTGSASDVIAEGMAQKLLAFAPAVVVANANRPADLATAATRAEQAHAPLLLTSARAGAGAGSTPAAGAEAGSGARTAAETASGPEAGPESEQTGGTATPVSVVLRAEISALHPRAVLAVGMARNELSARMPGIRVVTDPAMLPAIGAPAPLRHVVILVHRGDSSPATIAASATARISGAQVVTVRGFDPRADPAVIAALAAARPTHVLAIGAGFGPVDRLASRVAVAVTGVQLPGGGQIVFPMHRVVALYGHPGAAALGALGQQNLHASIVRAREAAAPYRALSSVPVVPAMEVIATVAQGAPGKNRSYSYESTVASLRPWVKRATAAGMYVVLDLQPGRANLLSQAKRYEQLLKRPNVGLALDPEWKLQPGQLPLRQIGSVGITEVNSVISWLADLTGHYHLPQKLLVLHQFRLSMIRGERRLDVRHDDLAIVIHMDGQGSPTVKQQTWEAITKAAPQGVYFGWKNFYAKDHPMLSPPQTMARIPQPVMVSYQ